MKRRIQSRPLSVRTHAPATPIAIGCAALATLFLLAAAPAFANHPVMVEGNCNVPPAASNTAPDIGVCGDWDGDGLIGEAEDADGDRVFGTITAALEADGVNHNGRVTVVTSGTFAELVRISGNVTLEAAPGVEANIDAVLQGDPGSGARQGTAGILVDAPANRRVVLRNLVSRNWTAGIGVLGESHVTIDNCRMENNIDWGIHVKDQAVVTITNSQINATGYRLNPGTGDFPTTSAPMPGDGIEFEPESTGLVANTTVTGSFRNGIRADRNLVERRAAVFVQNVVLFDNGQDLSGRIRTVERGGQQSRGQNP